MGTGAQKSQTTASSRSSGADLRTISLLVYLALLLLTLLTPATADLLSADQPLSAYIAIALAGCGLHLVVHNDKNWVRIDTIFLIGYLIVYYQWTVMMQVSSLVPEAFLSVPANRQQIVFGTWVATVGLLAWLIGYSILRPVGNEVRDELSGGSRVDFLFLALIVSFVLFAGSDYLTGSIYREIRQGGFVTMSGPASYIFTLLSISAVLVTAIQIYANDDTPDRRRNVAGLALLIGFYLLFAVAGERGAVIEALTAAAVLYCSMRRPIGFVGFALLATVGAAAFSALGLLRAGIAIPWEGMESDGLYGVTVNLANSARAFFLGLEIVERRGELFWGQLWLGNIFAVVPFAQSTLLDWSGMTQPDINSAYLIAYYRFGPNPHTADGSTLVGDIYMNFGLPGVAICLAGFGVICRQMQRFATGRYGFMNFVAAGLFASLIFYISRGTFLIQLRPMIWGLLLVYLLLRIRPVR